jgi:large subunit ribosomal protein L7/L12
MDEEKKVEDKIEEVKDEASKAEDSAEEAKESAEEAKEAAEEAKEEVKETVEEAKEEVKEEVAEVKEEVKETAAEVKEEVKAEVPKPESKKEIKVTGKLADIIKDIEELSVIELADLVKALEDRFGVSAAAPVAVAAAGVAPAAGGEAPDEGQTTFNVMLADSGANKIGVIKVVRELVPTLGLKEAKDLVDAAPKQVLEGVNKETANEAKTKLETAGAKVELK